MLPESRRATSTNEWAKDAATSAGRATTTCNGGHTSYRPTTRHHSRSRAGNGWQRRRWHGSSYRKKKRPDGEGRRDTGKRQGSTCSFATTATTTHCKEASWPRSQAHCSAPMQQAISPAGKCSFVGDCEGRTPTNRKIRRPSTRHRRRQRKRRSGAHTKKCWRNGRLWTSRKKSNGTQRHRSKARQHQ